MLWPLGSTKRCAWPNWTSSRPRGVPLNSSWSQQRRGSRPGYCQSPLPSYCSIEPRRRSDPQAPPADAARAQAIQEVGSCFLHVTARPGGGHDQLGPYCRVMNKGGDRAAGSLRVLLAEPATTVANFLGQSNPSPDRSSVPQRPVSLVDIEGSLPVSFRSLACSVIRCRHAGSATEKLTRTSPSRRRQPAPTSWAPGAWSMSCSAE
jgi:hypothetical protein